MIRNALKDPCSATTLFLAAIAVACRSSAPAPTVTSTFDKECSAEAGYPGREVASEPAATPPDAGDEAALQAYAQGIARDVLARQQSYLGCYGMELPTAAVQEGRVAVYFSVEPDGSVSTSRVTDATICPKEIGCCIANTIRRMRFRPPPDGKAISVEVPIVFDAVGSKSAFELGAVPSDPNCVP